MVDRALEDALHDQLELDHVADVLVHHAARLEIDGEQPRQDLDLAAARGRAAQQPRRLERRADLDKQHAPAPVPGRERERRADDALSHPALAGQDHHAAREERIQEHPAPD